MLAQPIITPEDITHLKPIVKWSGGKSDEIKLFEKYIPLEYTQFGKKEHRELAEYFHSTKNKCLMVIGRTDFIANLYEPYIVDEYEKKYRFKLHSGRVGDEINNTHLVIKNY